MIAIFTITDGANGEDDADLWVMLAEHVDSLLQVVSTRVNSEFFFLKKGCRTLLTIVDYLARFLQTIDMIGAESEENREMEMGDKPAEKTERPSLIARLNEKKALVASMDQKVPDVQKKREEVIA